MAQAVEQKQPVEQNLKQPQTNDNDDEKILAAARDNLIKTLSETPVSELQFAAKAIVLDSELDAKIAIETLLQHKIRAAPVLEKGKFIGVLDLRDTVKYALEAYDSLKNNNDDNNDEQKQDAKTYITGHESITSTSLSELCKHRPFRYVSQKDTLLAVANLFAEGCH
eukprot:537771_1